MLVIPNRIEVAAGAKVLNYILKGVKIATFSQMFLQEFRCEHTVRLNWNKLIFTGKENSVLCEDHQYNARDKFLL